MRGHSQRVKILVIDCDLHLLRVLARNLQLGGYEVLTACDDEQALGQVAANSPDLILLNTISSRLDDVRICQRVRECCVKPIICITVPGCRQDKSRLLELGVSEYVTSSFDMSDLLAHIDAVLHTRLESYTQAERSLPTTIGELTVNYAHSQVMLAGREVPLTRVEYLLVACLAQYAGRIVPQEFLIERVWGKAQRSQYHVLRVNINRVRRKLETDPVRPRYLLTKYNVGYLLTHPG